VQSRIVRNSRLLAIVRKFGPAIAGTILLLLLPISANAQKLVYAWSAVSALNSPLWIMKDAGFLKQEGIDADLVYIPSSPTVARATLAGEIILSGANSQVIVDVGLQGGDLVAMGAITNVVAFYIMAVPEIRTVADLKGKTIGVTRFGASTDFGIRMFLAKHGLEPIKDVPFVQIGGMPEIAAAISKRTIAAAAMSHPMSYVAEQAGIKVLANMAKEEIPFMHIGLTTTRKFMKERRAQAKGFIRAYGKAVHFLHTRKEQARAIFARYTKITDQKMLDGSIQYAYDFIEKLPVIKSQAFQVTLEESARNNPRAKQAKPEQFYDNTLVQELIDEGFFAKLWAQNR
jgi:ABC-type nitrate/sulfonate/bicarbonate transport system substrate-binding protein